MNFTALHSFLSEANLKEHLSYFRNLKNKYSIIEKSCPELKGRNIEEILKMNLKRRLREEALGLLYKIRAHELYFSSFTEETKPSPLLRKYYSSENSFIYEMKCLSLCSDYGYIYIYRDNRGVPRFKYAGALDESFVKDRPMLLVDLYEHAYFADYGFNYSAYLDGAFSHLDLSRLNAT